MSESSTPVGPAPQGRPRSGYQRSTGGLVGALLVVVLVVVGFAVFRAVTSDKPEAAVRSVDHTAMLRAGQQDGKLAMLAPKELPAGWRATSATYRTGVSPSWHLGMLTGGRQYVGLEEARSPVEEMVREHVDPEAERDGTARVRGRSWQVWRDAGGDYALVRRVSGPTGDPETVLVVGSAPERQIEQFAGMLGRR